jgi:hypothetical protein
MVFINDVKMIYKGVIDRNNYDCSNKTPFEIVQDFKVHIMEDVNSILIYAVYSSSRFVFSPSISDELVSELRAVCDTEISTDVNINNNLMWLDFNILN